MTIRYTSLRFVGSALLGTCFALVVTSLVYVATNRKPEILVLFFPLAILFTWAAVSLWERARKEAPILSESDIGLERFQSRNRVSKRSIRTTAACSSGTLLPLRAVPCFPATDFPPMLGRYYVDFRIEDQR